VKSIIGLLLPCVLLAQIAAGEASHEDSRSVVLRVSDWQLNLKPTAGPNNVGNCLIVYADGRLHLELRRQEFFGDNASLSTYEGVLSNQDLAFLRSILDSADVRKLPKFRLPRHPSASDNFESFVVDIYREEAVQKVGYFTWEGEPKPREDDKAAWAEQRAALQPLVQWSRETKSFKKAGWRRVHNANSTCQP